MKNCKEENKLLASLAVFRELYDSKKDVYEVIAEFVREIIVTFPKYQFNLTEISQLLNSNYEFNLPEAVINSALNRLDFFQKSEGMFLVDRSKEIKTPDFNKRKVEIEESNSNLIDKLFSFITEETGSDLSHKVKEKIIDSFCSFLLDEYKNQEYLNYISAFVIKYQDDDSFTEKLNLIREGVILYTGLKYSDNEANTGSWKTHFTIFIDTEVLFNFAGYDGELYKTLFTDFLSFTEEINQHAPHKLIELQYFKDVKDEIDRFFAKAEQIVSNTEKLIPSKTAMSSIVSGCKTPSDVVEKMTRFYDLLNNNDIVEDDYNDYFLPEYQKYNISDPNTIANISKTIKRDDISEHLRFLNFVKIRRKDGVGNNFERIGYILLSGNTITHKVAWHDDIKQNGIVPLVTSLSFITNKFWFKLNKGFGNLNYPKSFDVITRAQIALASQLNESVSNQFDSLKEKHKKGEITEDQAVATIVNLRQQTKKPEEIIVDNISDVLHFISDTKIERYILEHEHVKNVASVKSKENEELKESLVNKTKELEAQEKETENYKQLKNAKEIEIIKTEIKAKEDLLSAKEDNKIGLEKLKVPLTIKATKSYVFYKVKLGILLLLFYSVICFLIWKLGWDVMEAWTYIVAILLSNILPLIYLLVFEKTINPSAFLKNKKVSILNKKYIDFDFDIEGLIKLIKEIELLKKEISEQKKASTQPQA